MNEKEREFERRRESIKKMTGRDREIEWQQLIRDEAEYFRGGNE